MKVLVTRTDRLGDLVLSLPAMVLLKQAQPGWDVQAMVAPTTVPLIENEPSLSRIWTWHDKMSSDDRSQLAANLRSEKFDVVVMLYFQSRLAKLLRDVGIKRRYGPLSKWTSWFLLNRGSRQKRSAGHRHEAQFNLDLVRRVLSCESNTQSWPPEMGPQLHLSRAQQRGVLDFRQQFEIEGERVIFVHPGSGGSALDWEPERFAAVANELAAVPRQRVFVTGAGPDAKVIGAMNQHLAAEVTVLLDAYILCDLLPVLAAGDLFIGPSTGPLHMASALGVPTLGLFPPAPTMHPNRWGPQRPDKLTPLNMVPQLSCPARRACHGTRCEFHNCLEKITVASVVQGAQELLTIDRSARFSPVEVGS